MSEDERPPGVLALEATEDFMQHVETGSAKIRVLAVTSVIVAALLVVSYAYELLLPFATGTKIVEVNLADPTLMALEVFLTLLALAWLYLGFREYLFTARLNKQIREIRRLEHEILQKAGLPEEIEQDQQRG